MGERNDNLLHTLLGSDALGFTVEMDSRDTRLIVEDLDLLHRGSGTLGLDAEGLEGGFLADPSSSEGGGGRRLLLAVRDLSVREVAGDEVGVVRRNSGNEF